MVTQNTLRFFFGEGQKGYDVAMCMRDSKGVGVLRQGGGVQRWQALNGYFVHKVRNYVNSICNKTRCRC